MLKAAADTEQEGETQEDKQKKRKNMLVAYILDAHPYTSVQNMFPC